MEADNPTTAKAVAMCVLFLASFTLGTLPIKLAAWLNWKTSGASSALVDALLCIGGGVLLCTTFLHLLPEVHERLETLTTFDAVPLPMAETLMCAGFFAMYLVEECVHTYLSGAEGRRSPKRGSRVADEESHTHIDHSHVDHGHLALQSTTASIRGLLIVLALSIHELFEGFSVGLEAAPAAVWYMFGAVSAHKFVIAFCIGVELVTSGMRTVLIIVYVFTFAVVSPMGIGFGILVTEAGEGSTALPSAVLQGLATGTLLYVVFFEILKAERKVGLWRYFAILGGFVAMAGITTLESD